MRGMLGTRVMFTRIPRNLLEDSGECYYFNITGNIEEDSGEFSRTFRGMLAKIPGNVQEHSGECTRRFLGMLKKIPGNVQEHYFYYYYYNFIYSRIIRISKNMYIYNSQITNKVNKIKQKQK